jgi:hypothetical protein
MYAFRKQAMIDIKDTYANSVHQMRLSVLKSWKTIKQQTLKGIKIHDVQMSIQQRDSIS